MARRFEVPDQPAAAIRLRERTGAVRIAPATRLPPGCFRLRVQDVFVALPRLVADGAVFDLIMADPPFGEKNVGRRSTSLSQRLLDDEELPWLLAPDGLFVLGHTKRDTLTLTPAWAEVKEMKHGDSMMRFLRRK